MGQEFLDFLREKARERILFLPHAVRQMMRPDRMIGTADVRKVIFEGKIIEDYPEDARGHSCLMLGYGEVKGPCMLYARQKMSIWQLSLLIFQVLVNGLVIISRGEKDEMYVLPGRNETWSSAFSY